MLLVIFILLWAISLWILYMVIRSAVCSGILDAKTELSVQARKRRENAKKKIQESSEREAAFAETSTEMKKRVEEEELERQRQVKAKIGGPFAGETMTKCPICQEYYSTFLTDCPFCNENHE